MEKKVFIESQLLARRSSIWIDILKSIFRLHEKGVDLFQYCIKKVDDGTLTFFVTIKMTFSGIEQVPLKTKKNCRYKPLGN